MHALRARVPRLVHLHRLPQGGAARHDPGGRARQRNVLDRFAIDFSLCMYCGICIEVCPFDALHWSPEFEYAELDIRDLIHEKDRLGAWMATVPPPPPSTRAAPRRQRSLRRPGRPVVRQERPPPPTGARVRPGRPTPPETPTAVLPPAPPSTRGRARDHPRPRLRRCRRDLGSLGPALRDDEARRARRPVAARVARHAGRLLPRARSGARRARSAARLRRRHRRARPFRAHAHPRAHRSARRDRHPGVAARRRGRPGCGDDGAARLGAAAALLRGHGRARRRRAGRPTPRSRRRSSARGSGPSSCSRCCCSWPSSAPSRSRASCCGATT